MIDKGKTAELILGVTSKVTDKVTGKDTVDIRSAVKRELLIKNGFDAHGYFHFRQGDVDDYSEFCNNYLDKWGEGLSSTTDFDLDVLFAIHMNAPQIQEWIHKVNTLSHKKPVFRLFIVNQYRLDYYSLLQKYDDTRNFKLGEQILNLSNPKVINEVNSLNKNKDEKPSGAYFLDMLCDGLSFFKGNYIINEDKPKHLEWGLLPHRVDPELVRVKLDIQHNMNFEGAIRGEYIYFGEIVTMFDAKSENLMIIGGEEILNKFHKTFSKAMKKKYVLAGDLLPVNSI